MIFLILLVTVILIVLYGKTEKTMIDVKGLIAKVDALTAIVPNIKADYESLSVTVTDLQVKVASMEGVDPELQALIDSLDAKLGASLVTLKALDESVPGAAPAALAEPVIEESPASVEPDPVVEETPAAEVVAEPVVEETPAVPAAEVVAEPVVEEKPAE